MRSTLDIHVYAFPNYHLGADMRNRNPRGEDFYWEAVWDHIRLPSIKWRIRAPEKVTIYGEFSEDQHLRALVQRMLRELLLPMGKKLPEWADDSVNATFVGALGAADFAMRKPFWDRNKRVATEQRMIGPQIVLCWYRSRKCRQLHSARFRSCQPYLSTAASHLLGILVCICTCSSVKTDIS